MWAPIVGDPRGEVRVANNVRRWAARDRMGRFRFSGEESVGGARDARDICCKRPTKKEELTGVAHQSVV